MIFVTQYNFYWFPIGYVVAAYPIDWAVDGIWFRYVEWSIARANRENRERRTDGRGRSAAKGPARLGTPNVLNFHRAAAIAACANDFPQARPKFCLTWAEATVQKGDRAWRLRIGGDPSP